jgi:YfiH family protein
MITNYLCPYFKKIPNVSMMQTKRQGGFSTKSFSSLNLSYDVGDNFINVYKNLNIINSLAPNIQWISQIHGNKIIELPNKNLVADAVFTRRKNIICAVRTADCLPILLTDDQASFVAAIHVGWRGLGLGIIENSIDMINSKGEIFAWLGPSISQEFFEVDHDVFNFFINHEYDLHSAFINFNTKFKLSLPIAAKIILKKKGVKNIYGSTINENFCTFKEKENFFSYRRDGKTGRMASLIWINE